MTLRERADAVLRQAVSNGDVPGVTAIATSRDDTIYAGAFGERWVGGGAMTPDTVVLIASMTKPITGVAAMQLVEQGKLDLDVPARNWVSDLAVVQVLEGFDDAGEPMMRPPKQSITLRQLLTHSAGFGYEIFNEDIIRYQESQRSAADRQL